VKWTLGAQARAVSIGEVSVLAVAAMTPDGREQEQDVKFRTKVEPNEPMRGLEVPPKVVDALGGGKRPRVIITIKGHPGGAGSRSCVVATCSA